MTAADHAVNAGLPSLAEAARIIKMPKRTLERWHHTKPKLFEAALLGAAAIHSGNDLEKIIMSQNEAILKDLKRGKKITPLDALKNYGSMRLAARIDDLRAAGHNIKTKMIEVGEKHVAQYYLVRRKVK